MPARLPTFPPVLARICVLTNSQLVAVRFRVLVQNGVQASAIAAVLVSFWCWLVKLRTLATHLLHAPAYIDM